MIFGINGISYLVARYAYTHTLTLYFRYFSYTWLRIKYPVYHEYPDPPLETGLGEVPQDAEKSRKSWEMDIRDILACFCFHNSY